MARPKTQTNGRLEESMSNLAQAQTALVQAQATLAQNQTAMQQNLIAMQQNQTAFLAELREMQRANAERFTRIETILLQHSQILAEHSRKLETLPEAVSERMGFRPPERT